MAKVPLGSENSEVPHLSTFVSAAERGSFTETAAALGISQAAVSQRIARIEKELRVSLFCRRGGRVSLTEAGRRLYEYGRRIIDLHHEARATLEGVRPAIAGELSIAASSVPGECFLPRLLFAFHSSHPRVHVRATVGDSRSVLADVEKGDAALGLVGRKADGARLECQPIGGDALVLIVPKGHAWAARRDISLDDLAGTPLIVREPGSGSRFALEKGLDRAGTSLADQSVSLELGSNAGIKEAVKRGLGIAFLSRLCVQREIEAGELCAVPVRGIDLRRRFYLVYERDRPLPQAARAFRQFLASHPIAQVAAGRT